jgi:hypothetical protein
MRAYCPKCNRSTIRRIIETTFTQYQGIHDLPDPYYFYHIDDKELFWMDISMPATIINKKIVGVECKICGWSKNITSESQCLHQELEWSKT